MKKWIGALCVLLLLPALARGEAYTIGEVRKQAEGLGRWKQTYTDDYGRNINIDVVPIIANAERVPILVAESPVISEENVYSAFPRESVKAAIDSNAAQYTYIDNNTGANISVSIASPENLTFPTPECRDITIISKLPASVNSSSPNLVIHEGFFALPYEIDLDAPYLGENGLTVRECLTLTEERLSSFFPDYDLQFDLFRFGFINAPDPYYSCAIRQILCGIPVLMCSNDPVLNTDEQTLGFPPLEQWKTFYRLQFGTYHKPSWIVDISDTRFNIVCRPLKVGEVLFEDVPLCSMDKVIETLESRIQKGCIRNVYSLRFGYCCYFDGDEDIVLYPVWEIECDYMFNPKKDMAEYKENTENPVTSRLYYRTMIVNAQTGEFMDPIELKEDLLDCPEIIKWEDVQS